MDVHAHRLMYDNIHDFKTTAAHVESEIKRHGIQHDNNALVPEMQGRRNRDMWISMKSVSHFNLGIALELLLKMILILNRVPYGRSHNLVKLYDSIPGKDQGQLESTYQDRIRAAPKTYELVAYINSASPDPEVLPPLENRDIATLRGMLGYFDEEVMLAEKRYSWELISQHQWRHYVSDLSIFFELIDEVMANSP